MDYKVNKELLNEILSILGKMPFETVAHVITKMQHQIKPIKELECNPNVENSAPDTTPS